MHYVISGRATSCTSCRYSDTPEIKAMIAQHKHQRGALGRILATYIADARNKAECTWLAVLVQHTASGDCTAVAYFRKRTSALFTQGSYCM